MRITPDSKLACKGEVITGAMVEFRDGNGNMIDPVYWYDDEAKRYQTEVDRVDDEGKVTGRVKAEVEGELTMRPKRRIHSWPAGPQVVTVAGTDPEPPPAPDNSEGDE